MHETLRCTFPHLHSAIITPGGDRAAVLRHDAHAIDATCLLDLPQVHHRRAVLIILAVIAAEVILTIIFDSLHRNKKQ